jgi:chemotaxis protein CheD
MASVRHIAEGCLHAGRGPLEIRTIVSTGYAVALHRDGAGALLHVARRPGTHADDDIADESWFAPSIARLLEAWRRLRPAGEAARAEIIGGADVLRILNPRLRERLAALRAAAIAARLRLDGILVRRWLVGGAEARRVALLLPEGSVEVATAGTRSLTRTRVLPDLSTESAAWVECQEPPDAGERRTTTVHMGCMHVDRAPHRLAAVLGSCVGLALFDPSTRIGGLAHVVLPRNPGSGNSAAKYADTAVAALLESLLRTGAHRDRVCAKITGGANSLFMSCGDGLGRVAEANVAETRSALARSSVPLLAEDVGGRAGRRVVIDLRDFRVEVSLLGAGEEA